MNKNCKNSLMGQMVYMAGVGTGFLFFPAFVTGLLQLGPSEEVWIRVVGALALLLCFYYYAAVRAEALWFAQTTVWGRYGFVVVLFALAYLFQIPMLAFVGATEGLLAAWTHTTLASK